MRGLKSTIALIVVLAGLGAYIYFVTWKQPEAGADTGKKQEKVFAGLDSSKIEEVKVTSAAGDATTVKKDAAGWQLVQPLTSKADEGEVGNLTSALANAEIIRVIDENPTNLNEYGLGNPRIEVDFKATGDKDYRKLLVGEKTATGSDLYAKRNDDKKVFLIAATQETSLNRTTFDLRDKGLLKFDRDKVDGVDVSAGGKTIAIVKDGSDWKLTKPVQTKADFGSVEGLVGRLQSAQMKSIVGDEASPADLKKYGLDKPEATVNLAIGSSRATLLIGGKADKDNTVYARDASKPMVVTVEQSLLDDLKKDADAYRRKDLFEFRPFNATHIELTRNGQTIVLDRVKGQNDKPDTWKRVSPNPGDVDKDKMDGLLSKLSNMRASAFVESTAKTGLDKPALVATVKFDEGKKEEKVTFGQEGTDVFAARPGEPGAAKADKGDFDEVAKSFDEISKPAAPATPPATTPTPEKK
ncbi:MAG TPA: DUF4340 domain-containing protein [Vicinamibacterales bacterium]|nr:DUF4340 domain-containing protein [Vicinamibacterales bacterium]